jgi:hypothetical protein
VLNVFFSENNCRLENLCLTDVFSDRLDSNVFMTQKRIEISHVNKVLIDDNFPMQLILLLGVLCEYCGFQFFVQLIGHPASDLPEISHPLVQQHPWGTGGEQMGKLIETIQVRINRQMPSPQE